MNVLVTALGTMASGCIVKQLRKREDIYIIGADIYPKEYIVTSNDVDKFIQVSTVLEPENYLIELIDICKQYDIAYIFPIIDEEVELLSKNVDKLKEIGTVPCVSGWNSIKYCRDKFLTYERLMEFIPKVVIETQKLNNYDEEWQYPVFIKPQSGRASTGCYMITSKEELNYFKNKVDINSYIVQKYYDGSFYTADTIIDAKNGTVKVLVREEILRNKNGCGMVVKIIKDEALENICEKIAKELDFNGAFNAEFIKNETGYHLIEINPRLSAGTEFSCMAGLDMVNNELNIMMGQQIITDNIKYGEILARRYETYDMQSSK